MNILTNLILAFSVSAAPPVKGLDPFVEIVSRKTGHTRAHVRHEAIAALRRIGKLGDEIPPSEKVRLIQNSARFRTNVGLTTLFLAEAARAADARFDEESQPYKVTIAHVKFTALQLEVVRTTVRALEMQLKAARKSQNRSAERRIERRLDEAERQIIELNEMLDVAITRFIAETTRLLLARGATYAVVLANGRHIIKTDAGVIDTLQLDHKEVITAKDNTVYLGTDFLESLPIPAPTK